MVSNICRFENENNQKEFYGYKLVLWQFFLFCNNKLFWLILKSWNKTTITSGNGLQKNNIFKWIDNLNLIYRKQSRIIFKSNQKKKKKN